MTQTELITKRVEGKNAVITGENSWTGLATAQQFTGIVRCRISGGVDQHAQQHPRARLRWHLADGWVFDPVMVGPDIIEYTLKEGPHVGRHAIQHIYYQRVAPSIETTAWYEENGAVLHITWYLETQTSHHFAALPAWLAKDMTVYRGDNQDQAFIENSPEEELRVKRLRGAMIIIALSKE